MMKCDPVTGACLLHDGTATHPSAKPHSPQAVRYVGDPMCSWCWGIAPVIHALERFCQEQGIEFSITMGGLRAGGGDPWNADFKAFLRREWTHIEQMTGQPFGFDLLQTASFNYDTEPACRAVVSIQHLYAQDPQANAKTLAFLTRVQHKFYVQGQDPKQIAFYTDICAALGIDLAAFTALFESDTAKQATLDSFMRCRQWGVRSFPTLLYQHAGKNTVLATGYIAEEPLISRLRQCLKA